MRASENEIKGKKEGEKEREREGGDLGNERTPRPRAPTVKLEMKK